MKMKAYLVFCTALVFFASHMAYADGDPKRGARIYGACAACHSLEPQFASDRTQP